MSDAPRAIAGSLVDARNVAAHKSFRLVIDIPAEEAMKAIEAFGWPTAVNPVPVAVARLVSQPEKGGGANTSDRRRSPALPENKTGAGDGKRQWSELSPAQQAGIRCGEPTFWRFLNEEISERADEVDGPTSAAIVVRRHCSVYTRADLNTNPAAAARWHDLDVSYLAWERVQ